MIERGFPKPEIQVRFLVGLLKQGGNQNRVC